MVFALLCLSVFPAYAEPSPEGVLKQKANFTQWMGKGFQSVIGYSFGASCPNTDDQLHYANGYLDWEEEKSGAIKYRCQCAACGAMFNAYESDLKQSYANQVSELPASGYGSDGSMYVLPILSFYHLDDSSVIGPVANGETKSNDFYCLSVNLPSIRYELLKSSYHSKSSCRYGVSFEYTISFLCSVELLLSSATYSTSSQSGQLSFVDSFTANYLGEAKNYQANSKFKAITFEGKARKSGTGVVK